MPCGIIHDGAGPFIKDGVARMRPGRIAWISAKSNGQIHMSGDYGEMTATCDILFYSDYSTDDMRKRAVATMIEFDRKTNKERMDRFYGAVQKWMAARRLWEYSVALGLWLNEDVPGVHWPYPMANIDMEFNRWAPDEESLAIHQPLPDVFEIVDEFGYQSESENLKRKKVKIDLTEQTTPAPSKGKVQPKTPVKAGTRKTSMSAPAQQPPVAPATPGKIAPTNPTYTVPSATNVAATPTSAPRTGPVPETSAPPASLAPPNP